jgi:hypothetical protein
MKAQRSAVVVHTAGAILLDLARASALLVSLGYALARLAA